MPGMDGLELCRAIRDHVTCPILFLTARIEEADRVAGLRAGGDDYILKPFSLAELTARVEAHLRRENRIQQKISVRGFGDIVVDYAARTVSQNGQPIELSKVEFDIGNCFPFTLDKCSAGRQFMNKCGALTAPLTMLW